MTPFEQLVKHNLDFPWLRCEDCEALAAEGEPIEIPCVQCPRRVMPDPDEVTRLTFEVSALLAENPMPEHPPPYDLLFDLVGAEDRETKREIFRRLGLMVRLKREHAEGEDKNRPSS